MKPEDIVSEAKERFKRCQDWESSARQAWEDDYKFANADADNGFQWPNEIRKARAIDNRPALTINKTRQHNLQIINDCRQNKASVKVSPTGGGASKEAAEVFEGIIRHIEYISNAQSVYDTANTFQVEAGIGYWRIVTDYPNERTFDQEIYIRRVKDPLTIYLDPDITEVDGSDARFAFVYEDRPRELFEKEYPKYKDAAPHGTLGESGDGWSDKDTVRVAEYYRRKEKKDKLIATESGVVKASDLPPEIRAEMLDDPNAKVRDIIEQEIEWFLIVGDEVADKNVWPGKYIPIVRVIGEETVIDGQLDRKGHTRALKDPQRTYNYWTSAAVEFVALQSKTPYIAPVEAISGLEVYWESANRDNLALLPYNGMDDTGKPIPPPSRQAPPTFAPAYLQGMQVAGQELQAVSGQYESQMGEKSNEKTGIAIQERQRKGDNATYHYIDHQAIAIRFTGRILIDLIPKIYDTKRVLRIVEENGDQQQIQLDPSSQQAYQPQQQQGSQIAAIFNPSVGEYDVISEVGPAFATKREEAFSALTQIATQSPEIMQIAGDLIMKAADFPMAEELAERLKNMVPAQALGGPPPQVIEMQQKMAGMQHALESMTQNLADEKNKRTSVEQQKAIDVYKAETDRAAVLKDIDPAIFAPMVHKLVLEAMQQGMGNVIGASNDILNQGADDVQESANDNQ